MRPIAVVLLLALTAAAAPTNQALAQVKIQPPADLAEFFRPPEQYANDLGSFRSPLKFADGTPVKTAPDWQRRRAEILDTWHQTMGPWPALIDNPKVETVKVTRRDNVTQHQLRLGIALDGEMVDAFLLVPDGKGPFPAVVVVYYDAQTGVGLGTKNRDYGWHLAKRGFIVLSLGRPSAGVNLDDANKAKGGSYLGPAGKAVRVQPLSALAYLAANAHAWLARRADVIAARIGIVGHSFGGKWALFASCLYDRFACAVWSDPGIVFDERNRRKENPGGSVNYWDVWYLGFELGQVADPKNPGPFRKLPSEGQARTGAYKKLVEGGHDLVELHALMAPRPFLVSGGTADMPERWPALNHAIAVNRLLGFENRVAMTNRKEHGPSEKDNEQVYRFFEWWLKDRLDPAPQEKKPFSEKAALPEAWDYAAPMKKVAARFRGTEGVVLHVGGSMTIANPYGTWARSGKGKTSEDVAILKWMHTDTKDKRDGWWLCRTELVHYRAYTAESGLKSAMLLNGGKRGLPTLGKMLDDYRPRMVTIECGIYDVEDGVALDEYRKNMAQALDLILERGAIPVLNTIPPFKAQLQRTMQFNEALRALARERGIPVLDLEREVLTRRPDDWFGTLMDRIHLTAAQKGGNPAAEPTAANLRNSGYHLRGWLTVQKIAEIKRRVLN
jgi:dienelactone hydrolase